MNSYIVRSYYFKHGDELPLPPPNAYKVLEIRPGSNFDEFKLVVGIACKEENNCRAYEIVSMRDDLTCHNSKNQGLLYFYIGECNENYFFLYPKLD